MATSCGRPETICMASPGSRPSALAMLVPGSLPISSAETASTMELEFFWMAMEFWMLLMKPLMTTSCSKFSFATFFFDFLPGAAA
jgi:hypothetical protein